MATGAAAEGKEEADCKRYFQMHHIQTYVNDSIKILLRVKDQEPKVRPLDTLTEYFRTVLAGTHVAFRDYEFISLTPYNRASFISLFLDCFKHLKSVSLMLQEYHSLLQLICPDFPMSLLKYVSCNFFADEAAREEIPVLFSKFMNAFQVVFYYQLFIGKVRVAYDAVLSVGCKQVHSGHVVVVPTSSSDPPTPHCKSAGTYSPRLDRKAFEETSETGIEPAVFQSITCDIMAKMARCGEVYPRESALLDVLDSRPLVSFASFIRGLVNSDSIQLGLSTVIKKKSPGVQTLAKSPGIQIQSPNE